MKIKTILTNFFFLITLLLSSCLSTKSSKKPFPSLQEIKNKLGAGVNLSLYEHTWQKPEDLLKEDITEKLNKIASAGFKTVRLPIAFDIYLYPNSSTLQPSILTKLKEIYFACYNLKLHLIITYHYGKINEENMYNGELDKIVWIWKQIQTQFYGHGYDYLFFELYNEPTIGSDKWKEAANRIISYIRTEDSKRVYIIGGTNFNGLNDLMDLGKLKFDNILYAFHFYEPYIFTHQGADWTNDKSYMTGLPYPYRRGKMPDMPEKARGTTVEKDYKKYYFEGTLQYISDRMNQIANFSAKNDMPLICTETGAITTIDTDSKKRYLRDITKSTYQYDIPICLWDYDQKFSIHIDSSQLFTSLKPWLRRSKKIKD